MFAQWLEEHQEEISQVYIALHREQGSLRAEVEMRKGVEAGILSLVHAVRRDEGWLASGVEIARRAFASGAPLEILAEAVRLLYVAVRQVLYDEQPPQLVEWLGVLGESSLLGSEIATKTLTDHLEEQIAQRTQEVAVFQSIVENSLAGIFTVDLESRFTFANRAAHEIFDCDYESRELVGQVSTRYLPEEDIWILNETVIPQALAGWWSGEVRQKRKDGSVFYAYALVIPLHDDEGQPTGLAITLNDITERKLAEAERERLLENLRQLSTMLDTTTDLVVTSDLQGNISYMNAAGLRMLGRVGQDPMTLSVPDFHTPEQAQKSLQEHVAVVMEKGVHAWENVLLHTDGHTTLVSQVTVLTRNEAGEPDGMGTIMRDITESKRAEEERERLQRQLLEAQQQAIQELSTPVIPVMDRILVMPLVGNIDSARARYIMRTLLEGIRAHRARVVILDITGVPIIDSGVAAHLDKTIQAARLKGARTIITGVSDEVAEAVVDLGIDWSKVDTLSDLRTGLVAALESMGIRLSNRQ